MKKWGWSLLVIILVVVGAVFGLGQYQKTMARQALLEQQRRIYGDIVHVVDNLHADIENLSPSTQGHDNLQEELRKMRAQSERRSAELEALVVEAHGMPAGSANSLATQEAIEKVQKYVKGYADWAHLSITAETQEEKSKTMLASLEELRRSINAYGSPDSGDTHEMIDRVDKLVKNFKKANEVPKVPTTMMASQGHATPTSGYWANPEYNSYRSSVRSIVARYDQGRRVLNDVLARYDRGQLGSLDEWNRQLALRRGLIDELDNLATPSGIYAQSEYDLRQILSGACSVMEDFANNSNSVTRQAIRRQSDYNTNVMRRLKRFYGL